MQTKFQVFVSSTYTDLIQERQDTLKSILDLGHIPSGMEGFFAADQEQLSYIRKIIDECDYYILIIAGRYGSIDETGVSYTETEYDYAVGKGITVLAFIHNDIASLPTAKVDTDPDTSQRLTLFKERVSQKRLVSFWNTREQLRSNIIISLSKAIGEKPGIGWVRGNSVAAEDILSQLNDFRTEVERLRLENDDLKSQMVPKVDNIATLNETFKIRYSYYDDDGRDKRNRIIDISWAEIFKIIGPSFFSPHQQGTIELSLKGEIRHRMGRSPRSLVIFDGDIDTIKIQMAAYGFMTIYSGQSVQGGVSEYMQLTEFGKRALVELAAVKAAGA
jgi:hypothetical protein